MTDAFPPLDAEALHKLEQAALEHMQNKRFTEALVLWETRLRSGESGLAPFPLYALCLANVGRKAEAKALCERTAQAISGLQDSERKEQLQQLLSRVMVQLAQAETSAPLPSPSADDLFGGGGGEGEEGQS